MILFMITCIIVQIRPESKALGKFGAEKRLRVSKGERFLDYLHFVHNLCGFLLDICWM